MLRSIYIALILALVLVTSCENDYSYRGDMSSIAFSSDTLCFDTVFTGVASATTPLMIYNRSGKDMTIDRIWLSEESSANYNININGMNATDVGGLHLRSGDSLYVFVNIMPPVSDTPISMHTGELNVMSGSNVWTAHLLAYGMNVRHISGRITTDTTLDNELPYLVSGTLEIDSAATLNITEGTTIYMSDKSGIDVYGNLMSQGTISNRVKICSSRIDKFYADIPGQWNAIKLMPGAGQTSMEYTEIAHSTYGLKIDSATTATLNNVIIRDATKNAVIAYDASTTISNSLLYNCGSSLVTIYGGSTDIIHCTMSNYYRWDSRFEASIIADENEETCTMKHLLIANSVVVGNQANEIDIAETIDSDKAMMTHCYMRLGSKWKDNDERLDSVTIGKDPLFVEREKQNFHLTEESPLRGKASAKYTDGLPYDYDGQKRAEDTNADIGALEYNPQNEHDKNE